MKNQKEVRAVIKAGEGPQPIEILQSSIVALANAFEAFEKTNLKQDVIITLLHDTSKIPKRDIKIILNCLSELKSLYLK